MRFGRMTNLSSYWVTFIAHSRYTFCIHINTASHGIGCSTGLFYLQFFTVSSFLKKPHLFVTSSHDFKTAQHFCQPSIIFRFSSFRIYVWSKERSTTHRSIAVTFSIFIYFIFEHFLF